MNWAAGPAAILDHQEPSQILGQILSSFKMALTKSSKRSAWLLPCLFLVALILGTHLEAWCRLDPVKPGAGVPEHWQPNLGPQSTVIMYQPAGVGSLHPNLTWLRCVDPTMPICLWPMALTFFLDCAHGRKITRHYTSHVSFLRANSTGYIYTYCFGCWTAGNDASGAWKK